MTRYPPNQLRQMADDLARDLGGDGMYSEALRQAADDCEDAERYRQFLKLLDPDLLGGFSVYHMVSRTVDELIYLDDDMNRILDTARTPKEQTK